MCRVQPESTINNSHLTKQTHGQVKWKCSFEKTPCKKKTKLQCHQFPPQLRQWSGMESTESVKVVREWGWWLLAALWHTTDLHVWVKAQSVVISKPSPREKNPFFLTYNFLNHTYFFIEFCIGYIKGSIWISPKANNQCRCHFPRSLNCPLYRVANLGRAYRFFSSSFDNLVRRRVRQIAYLLTSVVTASMRRCRQ